MVVLWGPRVPGPPNQSPEGLKMQSPSRLSEGGHKKWRNAPGGASPFGDGSGAS